MMLSRSVSNSQMKGGERADKKVALHQRRHYYFSALGQNFYIYSGAEARAQVLLFSIPETFTGIVALLLKLLLFLET